MSKLNDHLTQNLMKEIMEIDFHRAQELIELDFTDDVIAYTLGVNLLTVELLRDSLN